MICEAGDLFRFNGRDGAMPGNNGAVIIAQTPKETRMINYRDGNIYGWNGGTCPVHLLDEVQYWGRGGGVTTNVANILSWGHFDNAGDIIAFRVTKPHVEPKTIWVNEYPDGKISAHATAWMARMCATPKAIRIAVKYVEVTE